MTKLEITVEGSIESLRKAFPNRGGLGVSVWIGPISAHLSTDGGLEFERGHMWRLGVLFAKRPSVKR